MASAVGSTASGVFALAGGTVCGDAGCTGRPAACLQVLAEHVSRRQEQALIQQGGETWAQWWEALAQEPALAEAFAERERRFHWRDHGEVWQTLDVHEAALHNAGFRQVGVCWQQLDNRVLLAVR